MEGALGVRGARGFERSRRRWRIAVSSLPGAWGTATAPASRTTRSPLGGRRRSRGRHGWRLRRERCLGFGGALGSVARGCTAAAPPAGGGSPRGGSSGLLDTRFGGPCHLSNHARPNVALGAQRSAGGVHIHPPDHYRGGRASDRRALLSQGPARVDRLAGADGPRELPVQPFPLGDGGHGHVH